MPSGFVGVCCRDYGERIKFIMAFARILIGDAEEEGKGVTKIKVGKTKECNCYL